MKIPKELTNVTPLSKTLAIIVFLIVPFITFFIGIKYAKDSGLNNTPLHSSTSSSPTQEILNTADKKLYIDYKNKFVISFPKEWLMNSQGGSYFWADQQAFVDFYTKGKTNITLPETGVKVYLRIVKNLIPENISTKEAILKYGSGPPRGGMPQIIDINGENNGFLYHRWIEQMEHGKLYYQSVFNQQTRTEVWTSYLKGKDIYELHCEIDNNDPSQIITQCDDMAKSLQFVQ